MEHQPERNCGVRIKGGIYLITETSPFGYPLEYFIRDEPKVVSLDDLNMTPNGVAVRDIKTNCAVCNPQGMSKGRVGCWHCEGAGWSVLPHVLDVVGKENYPNVSDFIEETRMLGASRRAELGADDYKRLKVGSRLILIHEHAYVENAHQIFAAVRDAGADDPWRCPKQIAEHNLMTTGDNISVKGVKCARVWRYDLQGQTEDVEERGPFKMVRRTLRCGTSYMGYAQRAEIKPEYRHAIFMSLPIHRVELVDPALEHGDKLDKLRDCELPVTIVDF